MASTDHLNKLMREIAYELQASKADVIPPGWYSKSDMIERGFSASRANRLLFFACKTGRMITKKFRCIRNGKISIVPFYKETKR